MSDDIETPPPRARSLIARILLGSLLGGVGAGLVIALLLVLFWPADSYYPGGGWDLAPAAVIVFGAMGIPPALIAGIALSIVQSPPRTLVRDRRAVTIGAALGSLISPLVFYVVPLVGLAVAVIVAGIAIPVYRRLVGRAWRESAEPRPAHARPEDTHRLR